MIIDFWKISSIVLGVGLFAYMITPVITGLFIISSYSGNDGMSVELFVMSYCPYGIQAQQGIIPAIQALGDSVDFKVRFVDYIMHGKTEIDENLVQYCIQEVENTKYLDYISCFVSSKNSASCMSTAGIDSSKVSACVSATDTEFNITNLYNDKTTWLSGYYPVFPIHSDLNNEYGVQGSPTLIINGTQVNPSSRSGQGFLDAICSKFEIKPSACSTAISGSASTASGSCS